MEQRTDEGLVRGIRRWDLVALVLNAIIGAGIFGLPSRVYALSGTYSLLAYIVCAMLIILIILCFAELGSRFKDTGGPYLYARAAFGPVVAFEVGWLVWLARLTAFAALCNLFVGYLGYFWTSAASPFWRASVITTIVVTLTVVNLIGVRKAALVSDVFTIGKLLPLIFFIALGAFFIDLGNFSLATLPDYGSFSTAVLLLAFAFSGFESAVIPTGETLDPRRQVPFALLTGITVVAVLYISIQVVCIGTLPELARSERPLADAAGRFIGPIGSSIIAAGALISITGTLNSIMLAAPRLLFAMSEHRQLPGILAATHKRFGTPHVAILLSSAIMLGFSLAGTFISALTISTIIRLIAYAMTCAALPVLRRKGNVTSPAFTAPAGTAVSIAALVLCLWLLSSSTWREAILVAAAAAMGLLIYVAVAPARREKARGFDIIVR